MNCEDGLIHHLKHDNQYLKDMKTIAFFKTIARPCFAVLMVTLCPLYSVAQISDDSRNGLHDFDFEIGKWRTHLKVLKNPLSGSNTWTEYNGTTEVTKLLNGSANLVELDVKGPSGRIEALSMRLYNPKTGLWSLNFAGANDGAFSTPTIGSFEEGKGIFYNHEPYKGKTILVRFIISDITTRSCRFEQAYSEDEGKTWEINWIAVDTKID